jgi:hypothetical protein
MGPLLSFVVSHVLKQINLELFISISVTNMSVHLEVSFNRLWCMLRHNPRPLKDPLSKLIGSLAPILQNYVMHDHTNSHHFPHCIQISCSCMVPNNSPASLQNTKWSFHILPTSFLLSCITSFFLILGFRDCIHKCGPCMIYTICKLVPFV